MQDLNLFALLDRIYRSDDDYFRMIHENTRITVPIFTSFFAKGLMKRNILFLWLHFICTVFLPCRNYFSRCKKYKMFGNIRGISFHPSNLKAISRRRLSTQR